MSDEYAGGNQRSPTAKSNRVFSWLMGNRSPAHGTSKESTEQSASTITTSHVQSFASGSPSASGNVSPARTASPVGSSRSSASATRSPPRSPARRFVVPTLAMGVAGGGGRGPAVMMDIGRRTVYAQSDDDETLVEDAATIRSTADEMKELPPSVQITTRTVDGTELTENQVAEALRTVRTVSVEDNQSEPVEVQYVTKTVTTAPSTTVRYATKTEDGDNQVPAGGVRYFTTTTTSSADGGRALPPPIPVGQGGVRYVTTTTSADGESIPMNMPTTTVRYVTKTEAGDNQTVIPGQGGVRYVTTTTTSEDGKAMPMTTPTTTVRYVTKTEEGDNQTAIPGQGGVQYVTTTTTSENGARALPPPIPVSPSGQGGVQSVRYIAKSAASPAHSTTRVSPGGVRYMTKTMVVDGGQQMLSPAAPSPAAQSGSTNVRFFGPTSTTQPNVHYVTRVVNGQSVQVPVPAGVPSHDHRVQYVTTAGSTTTPPSVSPSEHQHVRYVVKSAASPHVQTTTTRTSLTGSADGDAVSHVPLSAVVASTVASREGTAGLSPAHHVPAALLRLDSTTEGLPSRHFRGIALTDTDSSDSEDGDVKMVFDIMLQKFVPVKKKRRSPRAAAAAATVGGAVGGAAGGAAIAGAGANESGAAGAVGPAPVTTDSDSAGTGRAGAIALAAGAVGAAAIASTQLESDMEEKKAAPSAVATVDKAEVKVEGSGVVGVASAEAGSFEEKATSPSPVAAVEAPVIVAESESKPTGSGLATGAAIGLAAAAAVGAAAVVATGASNPLSVSAVVGTPKAAGGNSPGGLTKRTPSQTKREPSPRQFFAPDKAPLVPDHEVALDMDAPGTQYAALRSPSCNEGPDGSRLGHIGMSLKVRVCRWLVIMLVPLAIILFLMILFYKGVTLRKFHASDYSYGKQIDMVDNYNGYVGLITSLFVKPIELVISIAVPILFFSFVAKALLGNKLSPRLLILMFSLSSLIGFLISNGFHGIYVQMRVKGVEPVIALSDLSLQFSAAAALSALVAANASSNASMIVTEGGAGNAITNTVLRTAIAPSVDGAASGAGAAGAAGGAGAAAKSAGAGAKAAGAAAKAAGAAAKAAGAAATSAGSSALLCSNTLDYTNVLGTSDLSSLTTLSTTTVATYGFPLRSWQEQMLPGALPETTVTIGLGSKTPEVGSVSALPMRVRTAANLFLHSAHIARDVFRWFGDDSLPLNANKVIAAKYGSDTGGASFVPLAELMNLTVSGNAVEETLAAPAFVSTVRTMYNQSLAGAVNISRSESTLEFSSVTLPNGYAFESVTMEIPLTKNFLSRRLTSVGSSFAEGTAPSNETDVFYDLDIANDCGPYAGACEVRRTEYDADGHVYEPPTTVRAFALCNNSVGTDELEVFIDSSVAQGKKSIAYTCNGKSDGGMLVVSVSSRIVGDAMIEGPSPLVPRLVAGMATLKNPRKVYSLTVGKLSWPMTNLARKFHAVCSAGVGKCTGLDYALTAALENATETLSAVASGSLRGVLATALDEERNKEQDYLIVGSDFLPLKLVPTFAYNDTETLDKPTTPANATKTKPVSGYPLITITKPLEGDSLFQNDGDVAAAANFKNVTWQTTKARTGASCSATVEARLNSVLNNHYYIERGVQPAYTAGMFFLFQDAVMRAQIALAGGSAVASSFSTTGGLSTLRFASTVEFMELRAKIPLLNFVLTMIGCGIIFVIAVVVAVLSARKKYSATEGHDTYAYAPPESFARVKLDRQLFPWIVMKRRVIDLTPAPMSTVTATTGSSNKGPNSQQHGGGVIGAGDEGERIDAFTVGNVRLEHDNRDVSVDVPFTMGK